MKISKGLFFNSMIYKLILLFFFAVIFCACTINFKIKYKTRNIEKVTNPVLSNVIFDIEEFVDLRKNNPINSILFNQPTICSQNGKSVITNSEKHYKKPSITKQLSNILAEHLKKRNSFKRVLVNQKDSADYYISGNLTMFYGIQEFSMKETIILGIDGVPTNKKTPGKIIFEIADIKIYNNKNELLKDFGTFRKVYEEDLPNGGIWSAMYLNVQEKLHDYFSDFVILIESEIENNKKPN